MKKTLVACLIIFGCSTCSFGQDQNPLPLPSSSPDSATVVFYRGSQLWRALVNFTIRANGVELCRLSNNRYLVYRTVPQKCTFTNVAGGLNIPDKEKLQIDLEGGKVYYVQCDIKSGLFTDRMEMTEVMESTARRKMVGVIPDRCNGTK